MLTTSSWKSCAAGPGATWLTDETSSEGRPEWSPTGHEIPWAPEGEGPDNAGAPTSRILIPYNGSRTALPALDVAVDWALAQRTEAWVLYVRPCDVSRGGHYFVETRAEARELVTDAVVQLRARGVSASGVVRNADRGRVADAILAVADGIDAKVIVLGTRPRGLFSTALLGSVSRSVTRHAARRVVLVNTVAAPTVVVRRQPVPPQHRPILSARWTGWTRR